MKRSLKAVAIADAPEVDLVPDLHESRLASRHCRRSDRYLVTREGAGQEGCAQSRRLPALDLFGMIRIANVEDLKTRLLERASKHGGIVGAIQVASFSTVPIGGTALGSVIRRWGRRIRQFPNTLHNGTRLYSGIDSSSR